MRQEASVDIAAPPHVVFVHLEDLTRYPAWTDLVSRADPVDSVDGGPSAWAVDLRGRVGPLARSKRLRMERVVHDTPRAVVFERSESGDRSHADWRLEARVVPTDQGSQVTMTFSYTGGMWGPVVERLLGDEIEQSRTRLAELVESAD